MTNPLATPDQFAAERDVVAMWQTETIKRARATAAQLFELAYGCDTPEEARPTFEASIDEYVTNYLFKAAASDAAHPRFVRDFMPAYSWDGRDVPGARMGGDNPDNVYRLAPIAHGGRYRVVGTPQGSEPAATSFTLVANYGTSVTVQTLEASQLQREADGSFIITIDDRAAEGRANHMTTAPRVKFLFVRESLMDWAKECSYRLTIEHLDRAATPPISVEQMAERAAFRLTEEAPLYYWFQRLFSGLQPNTVRKPASSGRMGGLVTQAGGQGFFSLAPDEVGVVRYQPAGAAYVSLELADWWFRSLDAQRRQSSLTAAQSVTDDDGWITAVIAHQDPGVANWLDTSGFGTVLFFSRWQGLPLETVHGGPSIAARVIKFGDIPDTLRRTRPIDAAGRARQIAARAAAWDRRTTV